MIYRIDMQHYLTHAIDYFTRDELTHFQYAIVSAKIRNGGRVSNMAKISLLYPTPEIIYNYAEYQDVSLMEKMYMEVLYPKKSDSMYFTISSEFIKVFVNPLKAHQDIMIICDKDENVYIDVLCKCLKEHYAIEVIDLNVLFSKGRIGPITINLDEIHDRTVDIARAATKEMISQLETTSGGREKLLTQHMSTKNKIDKLKELGIRVTTNNKKEIDQLLMDAWVNDQED